MGIFDDDLYDDPFESIFSEFFGRSPEIKRRRREAVIRSEEEDRLTDFIETNSKTFLTIELPGYTEKDVSVVVKGKELEIIAQKKSSDGIQPYLTNKLQQGVYIKKILPNFIDTRNFSYTVKNGVLEIVFISKNGSNKKTA